MKLFFKSWRGLLMNRKSTGVLMILSGLLFNQWAVGQILIRIGLNERAIPLILLYACQGILLLIGVFLLSRKQSANETPPSIFHSIIQRVLLVATLLILIAGAYGNAKFVYWKAMLRGWVHPPIKELEEFCQWLSEDDVPYLGEGLIKQNLAKLKKIESQPGKEGEVVKVKLLLAKYLLGHGRVSETISQLESAYELAMENRLPEEILNQIRRELGVAHLRSGEINHCINMHHPERCLFPISESGVWNNPVGAQKAISYFEAFLQYQPEEPGVRWLLNVVHMAAGSYPEGLSQQQRIPMFMIESTHSAPRFRDIAPQAGVDAFNRVGGAIVDDFDNDGFLDIVTSTYNPCESLIYYHNNGDGTFADRTIPANLNEQTAGFNLVQADYNNDGLLDILVLRGAWLTYSPYGRQRNSLLRQNPNGTFTDVTKAAGLGDTAYPCLAAAWADYDNDGDLDVYIGNEWFPSELYRNNGDGTFTDIADEAGVENMAHTKGVTWGDYDNDGDPDLYVSNIVGQNHLYRNNSDGTFTEVTGAAGLNMGEDEYHTFGTWFWDVDNDGWLDLFVAGYNPNVGVGGVAADYLGLPAEGERLWLFRNDGSGNFVDATKAMNLYNLRLPMGANYGDIDNDGFLDFYLGTGTPFLDVLVPNRMYRNIKGKYFADVTTAANVGHLQKGHGIAFGDLDNDGDQDIYVQIGGFLPDDGFHNALFENPGNENHWITIKLVGKQSNRSGIGARITLIVDSEEGERAIRRVAGSGGSFGANSLQQEIGVGTAERINSLEIFWPVSNTRQRFSDMPVDQFIEITEGDNTYRILERKPVRFAPKKENISSKPDTFY